MRKRKQRVLATVITLVAVALLVPISAYAEGKQHIDKSGDNTKVQDQANKFSTTTAVKRVIHYSGRPYTTTTMPPKQTCGIPQDGGVSVEIVAAATAYCDQLNTVAAPTPGTPRKAIVDPFVQEYFKEIPMPIPAPSISAPNGGICGVTHSLDLNMPSATDFTITDTPFGTLQMHVVGTSHVDWGDGTSDDYVDSGAPWPNSDITHAWTTAGDYVINVTSTWNATYAVGPDDTGAITVGTLTGLVTNGAIPAFHVFQAQAVLVQ